MSMYIKIQPTAQEWRPASRMAKGSREKERLLGQFAHLIADIYRDELVNAINSQRYKGQWEPLDKDYLEWKRRQGLDTRIWIATGMLRDSISVYRSNGAWVVGINQRMRYPGSKVHMYKVLRWMEYGTSRMPARPLFRPVKRLIQGRMRKYWNQFLASKGITP